jgi:hypothetical protein
MPTPVPPAYRRLLLTYPRAGRRAHEAVVLGTLLESDSAAGRLRPTRRDRMGFLLGGLLVRLPHRVGLVRVAPLLIADAGFHLFDQSNGADPERVLSEAEQTEQNAHSGLPSPEGEVPGLPPVVVGNGFGSPF